MLHLDRRVGETITIGDEITVKVVRISPHSCRIGIEAPKSVTIVREELTGAAPGAEAERGSDCGRSQ